MATLVIRHDVVVNVLDRNRRQDWLGCRLTAAGSMRHSVDFLSRILSTATVGYSKIEIV